MADRRSDDPITHAARRAGSSAEAADASLSRAFRDAITSGGDARLDLDPDTGRNVYHCAPSPDPLAAAFASTTANTISAAACRAAWARWIDLTAGLPGPCDPALLAEEGRRVAHEIAALSGLRAGLSRIVLLPSGTDAILLGTHAAASVCGRPLRSILVGAAESGSGVPHAARGQHYGTRTPTGRRTAPGTSVEPEVLADAVAIPVRDQSGAPRPTDAIDADVARSAARALRDGRVALVHRLDSSKTGLAAPSLDCLTALERRHGAGVRVLVDACQGRTSRASLRAYQQLGWTIALTGSKFVGGPPFSGALVLPYAEGLAMRPLAGYDPLDAPNLGTILRWTAALHEWRGFAGVGDEQAGAVLRALSSAARGALAAAPWLETAAEGPIDRPDGSSGWDGAASIFTFMVRSRCGGRMLDAPALRAMHRGLSMSSPGCAVGQPVPLGEGGLSGLRLALDARIVAETAARARTMPLEDAAAPVASRLLHVLSRLEGARPAAALAA